MRINSNFSSLEEYLEERNNFLNYLSMIKKISGGFRVMSESGRNMGTYKTEKEAKKRLQQIEYFKHLKK